MTKPLDTEDLDTEQPLDPAMARVQAKLRRLVMFSSLIMAVGLSAVIIAIVYRVFFVDATPRDGVALDRPLVEAIDMPEGGRIVATALDGPRALVTVETPSGAVLLVVDIETLTVMRRLELRAPR